METINDQTKRFLVAAKVAKLHAFEQLAINCKLVTKVCNIIHELQKERGVSNVYLASQANHFIKRRAFQVEQTQIEEKNLSEFLQHNFLEEQLKKDNHRLLLAISLSLQGIDQLIVLRKNVQAQRISPLGSTQHYCRLIASLLDIVYEAADMANEQDIAKALVALFNFLQAKEYAGQERAWGAIGFADKQFTEEICNRLSDLQGAQQNSLDTFFNHASSEVKADWLNREKHGLSDELNKLRKMIQQLANGSAISSEISEVWYQVATQRIEVMHTIEQSLIKDVLSLVQLSTSSIAKQLKEGVNDIENSSSNRTKFVENGGSFADFVRYDAELRLFGKENKSVYDLLNAQSIRIENIQQALEAAQTALKDQQQISRAKLYMIQQLKISEDEAHQRLRSAAMEQQKSMLDVAKKIVSISAKQK